MSPARVLLVDDDDKLRRVLALRLEASGFSVAALASGEEALNRLPHLRPQFVLADLRMPGMDGIELLNRLQQVSPGLPVAILTAQGDIPEAVRASHAGAVDFLTKPVDSDKLLDCIRRHLLPAAESAESGGPGLSETLTTRSPRLRAVLDDARRVARSDSPVLILGAGGTGKETLARAIHRASARRARPFVSLNCAAVPAARLEAELFGGARAPADDMIDPPAHDAGVLAAAEGGSLFLEDIDALPPELQARLLRVLQEREWRPGGEGPARAVDLRMICTAPPDLAARVKDGRFREDLYYRLNVVTLELPALAERREDIPVLVAHRLAQRVAAGAPRRVYAPEAMELLVAAAWPGNIRQLFNVVEQTAALSSGRVMPAALVRKALGEAAATLPSFDHARAEFTRQYLRQLLEAAGGNVSRAARLAGRNRTDFYKLLNRHGINPAEFKPHGTAPAPHRTADRDPAPLAAADGA